MISDTDLERLKHEARQHLNGTPGRPPEVGRFVRPGDTALGLELLDLEADLRTDIDPDDQLAHVREFRARWLDLGREAEKLADRLELLAPARCSRCQAFTMLECLCEDGPS